jgi:hypothetical protein
MRLGRRLEKRLPPSGTLPKAVGEGHKVALIGIAHALAVMIYRTLTSGTPYQEPNQPAPDERKRQRLIRHYVRRLGKLGVAVHSLRPESTTHHKSAAGTRTQHVHHKK